MSEKISYNEQKSFYVNHLKTVLLPFWLKRGMDEEYGGYYTCFDNSGEKLLSHDKYTWSQGRMVWLLSRLATMDEFSEAEKQRFLDLAQKGAKFLMDNCLLENGNCTFLMTREGKPKPQQPGGDYDTSISADCFVILGLSQYAKVTEDKEALEFARQLYHSVMKRVESNQYKTEPYPVPKGYKTHGLRMGMLEISTVMADLLNSFADPEGDKIDQKADAFMEEILRDYVADNNVLHEMIGEDGGFVSDTLLGRYVNPGHTIEDIWFILNQAMKKERKDILYKTIEILKKTFDIGWDKEFGGLFLFVDQDGGQPRGCIEGIENETMVQKVLNDWSSKLWWPHSEALYTTLLTYKLTGDPECLALYNKVYEYTFNTFPNPNTEIGEWIQIRNRKGEPEQKVVALPVKDPYHIIRNMILIIELMRDI